jgi:hypothetical protein
MKNIKIISILTVLFIFSSCAEGYKFTLKSPKKTTLNKSIKVSLTEKNNKQIDKIQFYVNGKEVDTEGNSATIHTKDLGVGKHAITALAFYPGKTVKKNGSFEVFADKKPVVYNYKIIQSYPHDKKAYTQGLEYYNCFLYETTGHRGESTLRKVEIKT